MLPLAAAGGLGLTSLICLAGGAALLSGSSSAALGWSVTLAGSFELELLALLDTISLLFLGSVAAVAGAVLVFSASYMAGEKFFSRFHLLVLRFVGSMALLILSPNLISLLLG